MRKVKLYLEDLSCPDCAKKIEKILNKTDGVENADVHFTTGKANVEYDPENINVDGLKDAVSTTGYQVIKVR
jgi:Cu+-exporting ATPase